jgi:uncharacterized integral membrane protein
MLSITRKRADVATVGASADAPTASVVEQLPAAGDTLANQVHVSGGATQGGETRSGHAHRMARRVRLHGYVLVAVALFAFVIALAAANTAHVKVSWLFGTSHVSLVWLVLATAILGWLLGLMTNAALHRRTRAPRPAQPRA